MIDSTRPPGIIASEYSSYRWHHREPMNGYIVYIDQSLELSRRE